MSKILTVEDITADQRAQLSSQQYQRPSIEGVIIQDLTTHLTEDGSFNEILRVQSFPDFSIAQINRSLVYPNVVKAWHLHFNQDEVWNVGLGQQIVLGLWDIRENSPTKGTALKIPVSDTRTVYIPRGVAHGACNISGSATEILYFVSTAYNRDQPDEHRLPWDSLGANFWEVKKE